MDQHYSLDVAFQNTDLKLCVVQKRTFWFPSIGSCWQLEVEYKSLNCWGFGYLSFHHTSWRLLTGVPRMLWCSWKYPSHSSTFSSCQLHHDDGSYMFGTSYRIDGICAVCLVSPVPRTVDVLLHRAQIQWQTPRPTPTPHPPTTGNYHQHHTISPLFK